MDIFANQSTTDVKYNNLPKLTQLDRGDAGTQTQALYLLAQAPSTIPWALSQDSKVKVQFPLQLILEVLEAKRFVVGFNDESWLWVLREIN